MSHFYAAITESARKTEATARGHKSTGAKAYVAGWGGKIETRVWYDEENDRDMFEVWMKPHKGAGDKVRLADGEIGNLASVFVLKPEVKELLVS